MTNTKAPAASRFKKITIIFLCVLAVYGAVSLALVYWPSKPKFDISGIESQDRAATALPDQGQTLSVEMRDGTRLFAQRYGVNTDTVVIWLHGITSESGDMAKGAKAFSDQTNTTVITPDLRGHAKSGGESYDVDYIGQYEQDLNDLMAWADESLGAKRVLLAGHSMGGGIVLRHGLLKDKRQPDGYLLLAPSFGEAPTQRQGGSTDTSAYVHFNNKRLFGLILLNIVGIQWLDHLPVLYFNEATGVSDYSYRAVLSGQPIRPDTADIALQNIVAPLLVIVGENDAIFLADQYADFVSANSDGKTIVIPELDHNQVVDHPKAVEVMVEWYKTL